MLVPSGMVRLWAISIGASVELRHGKNRAVNRAKRYA
jgi:hypothetical protein